jgi:hypothetical protein
VSIAASFSMAVHMVLASMRALYFRHRRPSSKEFPPQADFLLLIKKPAFLGSLRSTRPITSKPHANLRTLSADLDALIPRGSSDTNAVAPQVVANHLLAASSSATPADPWVGMASEAVKQGTAFATLR